MSVHFDHTLHIGSGYLSFGDCVHDSDSAERSQVVTAGVVVHLRQQANQKPEEVMQVKNVTYFKNVKECHNYSTQQNLS